MLPFLSELPFVNSNIFNVSREELVKRIFRNLDRNYNNNLSINKVTKGEKEIEENLIEMNPNGDISSSIETKCSSRATFETSLIRRLDKVLRIIVEKKGNCSIGIAFLISTYDRR